MNSYWQKKKVANGSHFLKIFLKVFQSTCFFYFSARVTAIIANFGASWKQAIDAVNREVMSSFPSFRTGAGVLQQALTLLIQYYHRFQKILGDHMPVLTSRQDLVNIHQLMVEVKKYKPNF